MKRFFNFKTFAVFALTVSVGLLFNQIFGRVIFKFSVAETFTRAEAEAKLTERVTLSCFKSLGNIDGTIVSYNRGRSGQTEIAVKFDEPISGKFERLNFDKKNYERCVERAK